MRRAMASRLLRQMHEVHGREHANIDFRIAHFGFLGGDDHVAGDRPSHAGRARMAVDRGDHRLAEAVQGLVHFVVEQLDEAAQRLAVERKRELQIHAGGEHLRQRAGEDHRARRGVLLRAPVGVDHLARQLMVDRVDRRAVHGDFRHAFDDAVFDQFCHGCCSFSL